MPEAKAFIKDIIDGTQHSGRIKATIAVQKKVRPPFKKLSN
jgi:hypothetical protein